MKTLYGTVAAAALICVLGCGSHTKTEKIMLDWAPVLNAHLGTDFTGGHSFPARLTDVDPQLRLALSLEDGWGNPLIYRRLRDDRYQLISAGADGQPGNADDLVLENAAFYDATEAYAKRPLKTRG